MPAPRANPLQIVLAAALLVLLVLGAISSQTAGRARDNIWGLALSSDARFLAATSDRGLTIYEPAARRPVASFPGVRVGVFSPDGSRIAVSTTNAIVILDLLFGAESVRLPRTPQMQNPLSADRRNAERNWGAWAVQPAIAMQFSPDGRRLAALQRTNGEIAVWDIQNQAVRWREHAGGDQDFAMAFSPNGAILATAGRRDGERTYMLQLRDAADGAALGSVEIERHAYLRSIAYADGGRTLLAYFSDGEPAVAVDVADPAAFSILPEHPLATLHRSAVVSVDGDLVASYESGNRFPYWLHQVIVRDRRSGENLILSEMIAGVHAAMCFPGDGSIVAATSDGVVARWSIASGEKTASYPGNRIRAWSDHWTWMLGACGVWMTLWVVVSVRENRPRVNAALIGVSAVAAGLCLVALHAGAASGPVGIDPVPFLPLIGVAAFISGFALLIFAIKARARLATFTIVLGSAIPMAAAWLMLMRAVASV